MKKIIEIGENGKVCLKWKVRPIDYSHEEEAKIILKFAEKYGIPKGNIKVEPVFINIVNGVETEEISNDVIDNIDDPKFQQNLFKKYIEEMEIKDCDFNKIIEIDSLINQGINYEAYDKHKKYQIKWIKWSNFMSYGPDNYLDLTKLDGLVLLSSNPSNQGGKTTLSLDLIKFLLFGKIITRGDKWVLVKAFNHHLPEATEMAVEGCISIDGNDYVIKRTLTRPQLKKRTEKSTVTQKVNYYRLVNDNYIELEDEENNNGQGNVETNKKIKEALGNEKDFDLMICVNADNLKGLISLKDTDRGRLLSRWIGLLPLEEKDTIARETYNKRILPNLLSSKINREDLETEIKSLTTEIEDYEKILKDSEEKLKESEKKMKGFNETRDTLLQSKQKIDESLAKEDVHTLEVKMNNIVEEGKRKKEEKALNEGKLKEIGEVSFSEDEYKKKNAEDKAMSIDLNNKRNDLKRIKSEIDALKKGEYCPTCGAKLKDVDNTKKIADKENEAKELTEKGIALSESLKKIQSEIKILEERREVYNQKNKLELLIAKNDVDIKELRNSYNEVKNRLNEIEKNKAAIENNNKIENSLLIVNENIRVENGIQVRLNESISEAKQTIKADKKSIEEKNGKILVLNDEEKTIRNWKIYLDMVGKNGISKMILRTALPVINGELKRLLNGVCDFEVEVSIDNKNDVAFSMIHDGVASSLGEGSGFEQTVSSLALRSVLSKISTFSKPNLVVFDEILGGVSKENYDNVRMLFDKIVKDCGTILQITHEDEPKEWAKHIILVKKENNISKLEIK